MNPTHRRPPRETYFDSILQSRSAQLRRAIQSANARFAPRHELDLLDHVLATLEGLDDRTRPGRNRPLTGV